MVHQLFYTSQVARPFPLDELRALLVQARLDNLARGVTGMLLHVDGAFFQVLEGAAEHVTALFDHIARDRRHTRVLKLLARDVPERNFADWSMGFFDASGRAANLTGYRKDNGFAGLLGDTASLVQIVTDFRAGRWRAFAA